MSLSVVRRDEEPLGAAPEEAGSQWGRMSTERKAGEGGVYNYGSLGLARLGRHGDLQLEWVLEDWRKAWPTQHERESPEIPRQVVEEGIQGSEK